MAGLSHLFKFKGHLLQWLLRGLGVIALGALFYRYLVYDGDFDVYWAATFRFLHGLKVHIYEQNVFTYPTFASFLLLPVYPLDYSVGKILFCRERSDSGGHGPGMSA